jgi:hypothetical protein
VYALANFADNGELRNNSENSLSTRKVSGDLDQREKNWAAHD